MSGITVKTFQSLNIRRYSHNRAFNLDRAGYKLLMDFYSDDYVQGQRTNIKSEVVRNVVQNPNCKDVIEVVYYVRYDYWGLPYIFIWGKEEGEQG